MLLSDCTSCVAIVNYSMSLRSNYNVVIKNRFAQLDSDAESDTEVPKAVEAPQSEKRRVPKSCETVKTRNEARSTPSIRLNDEKNNEGQENVAERHGAYRGAYAKKSLNGQKNKKQSNPSVRRDRRSGTGRGREMKKLGAGGHNWGTDGSILNETNRSPSAELAAPELSDNGKETPKATEVTEANQAEVVKEASPQRPKEIAFAVYQKELRQKRQLLQQENTSSSNVRSIDASVFEKDGLRRYEREETESERVARELFQKLNRHSATLDTDGEFSTIHTNVVEPMFQFRRPEASRRRNGRNTKVPQRPKRNLKKTDSEQVDLNDTTTFPVLC